MGRAKRAVVAVVAPVARRGAGMRLAVHASEPREEVVPGTPFTASELAGYSDTLLSTAGVRAGDMLAVELQHPSQQSFALALALAADRAGAKLSVLDHDRPEVMAEQMHDVIAGHGAVMHVQTFAPSGARALPEHPPAPDAWAAYDKAMGANELRWNVAVWPTPEWARAVYPELSDSGAYRRLGEDLLSFSRSERPGAMREHLEHLKARAAALNSIKPKEFRLAGPGTDLRIGTLPGDRFMPVAWDSAGGAQMCANVPTEEVFTTPDPASVHGTFVASRPLVVGSEVIGGVGGRFEEGRLVNIWCEEERHAKWLRATFLGNEGMDRVGELGLVNPASRIGANGRTYFNDILDENAGTHFALGASYDRITLSEAAQAAGAHGNRVPAQVTGRIGRDHYDIVIGHPGLNVSVLSETGAEFDVIKDGAWCMGERTFAQR